MELQRSNAPSSVYLVLAAAIRDQRLILRLSELEKLFEKLVDKGSLSGEERNTLSQLAKMSNPQ